MRRRQAEAFNFEIKRRKKLGERVTAPLAGSGISFKDLAARYLLARRGELRPKTLRDIVAFLDHHVMPLLGRLPCDAIRMPHLLEIMAPFSGLSLATRNRRVAYLKGVFNWGVRHEFIERNPFAAHKLRREPQVDILPPTPEEMATIIAVAPEHLAWALDLEWHTGCRPGPSELFSLRWADVDWARGGVWTYGTKTGTRRFIDIKDTFMEVLRGRWTHRDCEYLVSYQGKPVTTLKRTWAAAKVKAGVTRRLRLYDVRHAHITYQVARGADLKAVSQRAGHASTRMTADRYYHYLEALAREAAQLVPDLPPAPEPEKGVLH